MTVNKLGLHIHVLLSTKDGKQTKHATKLEQRNWNNEKRKPESKYSNAEYE